MARNVTKAELEAHIAAWPRPLERDVCAIVEPPQVSYNDFTFGPWPESIVASHSLGMRYRDLRNRSINDPPVYVEEPESGWRIHRDVS